MEMELVLSYVGSGKLVYPYLLNGQTISEDKLLQR
jgi:hypothetical protein